MQLDLETFLSKTSPAGSTCPTTPSAVSWEALSGQMMPCVRHSTENGPVQVWLPGQGHGQLGGFSTLNISEWPNDAAVCSLSQILEKGPIPQRFFLSAKACQGILRRAEKRGKELPEQLARALRAVAGSGLTLTSPEDCSPSDSGGGNCSGPIDKAACLKAKGQRIDFEVETFIAGVAGTLPAGGNGTGGDRQPGTSADTADTMLIAHSLRGEGFDASEGGTGRGTPIVPVHAFDARQSDVLQYGDVSGPMDTGFPGPTIAFSSKDYGNDATDDLSPTLRSMGHDKSHANGGGQMAVAWSIMPQNSGNDFKARPVDVAQPLMAAGPVGGNQGGDYIQQAWQVRRLTPTECERLQAFPDGFTNITYRGKPAADGPRYKALGNSWAKSNGAWIIARLANELGA